MHRSYQQQHCRGRISEPRRPEDVSCTGSQQSNTKAFRVAPDELPQSRRCPAREGSAWRFQGFQANASPRPGGPPALPRPPSACTPIGWAINRAVPAANSCCSVVNSWRRPLLCPFQDRARSPRFRAIAYASETPTLDSLTARTASSRKDLLHVAVGGRGRRLRTAAVLTCTQVRRIPVPPVVLGMRLLVVAVVLCRLTEELCKGCDVHGPRWRQLPFTAGKPRLDLLEQPAVPIRILERGKRVVGTTLRVAPADAWVLHGVVEGAAGVVEDLAHVNPAGDQVVAGGVDVVHGEDQAVHRARRGRRDSLAEDDRGLRGRRRELHHPEVFMGVVDVFTKPQCRIKALGTIDVGDGQHYHFEFHVHNYNSVTLVA